MKQKLLMLSIALLLVATLSTGAWAYTISGINLVTFNAMAGTEILSLPAVSPSIITANSGSFVATLSFKAYYDSSSSVYTYAYQLANSPSSTDGIARLTITNPYSATVYNMPGGIPDTTSYGYITDLSLLAPATFVDNTAFNGFFGFDFGRDPVTGGGLLTNGTTSTWMYTRFYQNPGVVTGNIINGGVGSGPTVGPVPEPGTMLLLGMGILGLYGVGRKRKI